MRRKQQRALRREAGRWVETRAGGWFREEGGQRVRWFPATKDEGQQTYTMAPWATPTGALDGDGGWEAQAAEEGTRVKGREGESFKESELKRK